MKTIEITDELNLSTEEKGLLDMHSFLNLMNILLGEIYVMELTYGTQPGFTQSLQIAESLKDNLADIDVVQARIIDVDSFCDSIIEGLLEGLLLGKADITNDEVADSLDNIRSVLEIMKVRSREILARIKEPGKWEAHNIEQLTRNFTDVLAAIEKNSKGKFFIVYNIASKKPRDYIVDMSIESVDGHSITMPPVLQDVFRDVIANARKYSDPGGRISAGLVDDGKFIRIVVKDEGRGIPESELAGVVNYGIRASNVGDKQTKGGGFGLTKAYFITKQFNGRMWISSGVGEGTTVTIEIPGKGD